MWEPELGGSHTSSRRSTVGLRPQAGCCTLPCALARQQGMQCWLRSLSNHYQTGCQWPACLPPCSQSKWPLLPSALQAGSPPLPSGQCPPATPTILFSPSWYLLLMFHFYILDCFSPQTGTQALSACTHRTESLRTVSVTTRWLSQTKTKKGCSQVSAWLSVFTFPVVCGLTGGYA